jgi:hypothetical protein
MHDRVSREATTTDRDTKQPTHKKENKNKLMRTFSNEHRQGNGLCGKEDDSCVGISWCEGAMKFMTGKMRAVMGVESVYGFQWLCDEVKSGDLVW